MKEQILNRIISGEGVLMGSSRPDNNVQIEKWILNDLKYLVTSFNNIRNDNSIRNYKGTERLELLTEII